MTSIARYQFPQRSWKDGERLLWNPVQKKALKDRPEERVRLRIIEAFMEMGWSKSRISTEESLTGRSEQGGRTDIICYDRSFSPKFLVECKAENVPISEKVAEQTARYNRSVKAPYLLMTNGVVDFWYHLPDRRRIRRLDGIPDFLAPPGKPPGKPLAYWSKRGFAGNTDTMPGQQLERLLNTFWFAIEGEIRFLSFTDSPTDLPLAHYYKIFEFEEDDGKTAVGFSDTPGGDTLLVAVFNRKGQNAGVMEMNIGRLLQEEEPSATCHSPAGTKHIDPREFGLSFPDFNGEKNLVDLPSRLNTLFDKIY